MIVGLLQKCSSVNKLKEIHCHMITASIRKDNHLLFKSLQLKDSSYATLLFSKIPRPNDYSYNIIIRGMATTWKDYSLALKFYLKMIRSGVKPNHFTYPFVLIAFANLRRPSSGSTAHGSIFKAGLHMDSNTQHCLITMYARCGKLVSARRVFDEIRDRDLVSWNSMISGYSKMGFAKEALESFEGMKLAGFEPNEMTVASVLASCGGLGDLTTGKSLEAYVETKKFELTSFLGSALIDMFGKCGDLDSARRVFDGMEKKDKVAWNAMITGYSQNGKADEAIQLFHAMRLTETKPDEITMVGVLSACASIGALDVGKSADDYWASASQRGPATDVYVGTALIDMYAKCGNLDRATEIFHLMPWKNEVTWNAMISAFAFHGQADEALSFFAKMKLDGKIQPDERTFLGVLSACAHAGWVSEGRKCFNYMESVSKISPQIEHYSCMVDLLARSGRVEEAWTLIERMPERPGPDAVMLGCLLSACRTCKNVEVGERVSRWLLRIEPWNSGNYVISSKIYAGSKRWGDSAKMRGLMRDRGVVKIPGCSWIEIWNSLHQFRSGDGMCSEIQELCDTLSAELKIHGYIPNVDLV